MPQIIYEVKQLILSMGEIDRIWIYGSYVSGDSHDASDLDIAYDYSAETDSQATHLREQIDRLDTLISIDIINISKATVRIANRVRDCGTVIYSRSQQMRVRDSLYNWQQALMRFEEVVSQEEEYKDKGFGDAYNDVLIKRFEFCFEMSWKTIKRYLDYEGITVQTPRETLKTGYAHELIHESQVWIDMMKSRNTTARIYDQWQIEQMKDRVKSYYALMHDAYSRISMKMEKPSL